MPDSDWWRNCATESLTQVPFGTSAQRILLCKVTIFLDSHPPLLVLGFAFVVSSLCLWAGNESGNKGEYRFGTLFRTPNVRSGHE